MSAFRSILVDVDPTAANHPAFTEACDLAARLGARVTLVDVIADVPSRAQHVFTRTVETNLVDKQRTALATLARTRPDVAIETAVLRGTPAIALVQEVLRGEHDLVVRSHARDLVPGRLHGAVDLHLLRTCPCPVWLVGPQPVARPPHILAAVDTEADDPGAAELNREIVDVALSLGEAWRARVTVLHAWSLFGEELLRGHMPDPELEEVLRTAKREALDGLEKFVATFGDRAGEVQMKGVKGEPRYAIPRFVTDHGVDVVIMGTVGRTGIAGFLMGNTAESVLRELRGSVVAVKPPRFVTRVAAPAHTGDAVTA